MLTSKAHYEKAANELANGTCDAGLWAMALAEALGDSNRTVAVYLRLRAKELASQELSSKASLASQEIDRLWDVGFTWVVKGFLYFCAAFSVLLFLCFVIDAVFGTYIIAHIKAWSQRA